jgi:excisionase family DNA binding protein
MSERTHTVDELADYLRVSPQVVRRWIREGRIRGLQAGRVWRIPPDEYERIMREGVPRKAGEEEEEE